MNSGPGKHRLGDFDAPAPQALAGNAWSSRRLTRLSAHAVWAPWLVVALSFTLTHPIEHCFASNQHTYLLHGFRIAHPDRLAADWLAGTTDALPVFSRIAATLLLMPGRVGLYGAHALLTALFALALVGLVVSVFPRLATARGIVSVGAGLTLLDAVPALRRLLFDGVARQMVLGSYLQPSTFGVLLLVATYFAVRDEPWAAAASAWGAAIVHPTYAMSAAVIACGVIGCGPRAELRRRARAVLAVSCLAAVCVGIEMWPVLRGASPATSAEAVRILAVRRIPHHALPQVWFAQRPWAVVAQITTVCVGLAVAYRSDRRLAAWLAGAALVSGGLTLLVIVSGDLYLALSFPWRISTWLVPVCTALTLGAIIDALWVRAPLRAERVFAFVPACLLLAMVYGGFMYVRVYRERPEGHELSAAIAAHTTRDAVLLTPPQIEWIRLNAQRAVVVDMKSHPFGARAVLSWWSRLQAVLAVYDTTHALDQRAVALRRTLELAPRVSEVLLPSRDPLAAYVGLRALWKNTRWALFAAPMRITGRPLR